MLWRCTAVGCHHKNYEIYAINIILIRQENT